jgi:hypothetical protein
MRATAEMENAAETWVPAAFDFLCRKEEAYFFLPAGFFAAVFLPAAFDAVFFFAAMCTSPEHWDEQISASILEIVNARV